MPRQSLFVQLFHEGIGVEFFYIPYTRAFPQTFKEHHGSNHGRYACCVAYPLHTSFLVGCLMAAVIIYVICTLLTVLQSTDTTSDRGFSVVVLAQVLRVGQYGLEELQRYDFHAVVINGVNACHAYILDNSQMCQVFLSESHPEACPLDGREVLYQRFQFFVVKQVGVTRTNVGIIQRLVYFQRLGSDPLTVFIIASVLGDFADVDFRIEVGSEGFVVVAGITVHNI